ncbi:hypothetical protein ACHZ98_20855 [Streptomyces sp. MAR4 CNY-716]
MPSAARLTQQPAAGWPSPAGGGAAGHGTAAARRRRLRADPTTLRVPHRPTVADGPDRPA